MSRDWPIDETPMVVRIALSATVRNDDPVAVLDLFDPEGEKRTVQVAPGAAFDLLVETAKFLRQIH